MSLKDIACRSNGCNWCLADGMALGNFAVGRGWGGEIGTSINVDRSWG